MGLTGFGCLFTVLGIFFLFDRGLLAMGNVRRTPNMCTCKHCPAAWHATAPSSSARPQRSLAARAAAEEHARTQLLFLAGVAITIGPAATLRFFMRRKNHKVAPPPPPEGSGTCMGLAGPASKCCVPVNDPGRCEAQAQRPGAPP